MVDGARRGMGDSLRDRLTPCAIATQKKGLKCEGSPHLRMGYGMHHCDGKSLTTKLNSVTNK